MAKGKDFDNILNECLDRLISGETIESCLERYPEYAMELEPLLKTALEARTAAAVKPRPEFRQRAGYEFQKAISEMSSKQYKSAFRWQLRWALPVAIVAVILIGGTGTVYAATNALPDSPLYGIKLATEQVQLAFTPSAEGKADLYAKFVDYRVEEIDKMAEKGELEQVERVTERMNNHLLAMADLQFNGDMLKEGAFALTTTASALQSQTKTVAPATTVPAPAVGNETTGRSSTHPGLSEDAAAGQGNKESGAYPHTDKEKLKDRLLKESERNLQILRERLAKAPEALKPALEKAIRDAEEGYRHAIEHLEEH